jgi:uncharacterized protein YecT (DUF1311 family)
MAKMHCIWRTVVSEKVGEAKMRRTLAVLALMAASCAPAAPPGAAGQQQTSIEACVAAATTREALWQCKGVLANPCMSEPDGQTTVGMIECQSREGDAWQALLDAHVARLNADDSSRSDELAAANAAWEAWREAECIYQASEAEGGSLAGVIATGCHADVTADRVIALAWAERSAEVE